MSRMRQHYERRKQDRPEFISDTDAFDVTAYMNGAAAKRIRHRVYLLKNCGIEPGSYLKTLVEVNGNQVLYEASMNFVFETNLEALPKHVPSHLTAEMVRDPDLCTVNHYGLASAPGYGCGPSTEVL